MQFGKLNFLATLGRREKLLLSGRNVRTHESLLKFSCQKQLKLENFDLVYVPMYCILTKDYVTYVYMIFICPWNSRKVAFYLTLQTED